MITDLRENLLSQYRQAYGLMPSCALRCLLNSSDLLNLHSHPGQLQAYGFSPVCRLKSVLFLNGNLTVLIFFVFSDFKKM